MGTAKFTKGDIGALENPSHHGSFGPAGHDAVKLQRRVMRTYARAMTTWREWQKDYRFGVILVLPPEPVRAQINALRAKYDPQSHKTVDSHISLTVPLQKEPDEHLWAELERIASRFQAFPICYGPLVSFLPKAGAALDIQPQAQLDKLRIALEVSEVFLGAPPRRHRFWAHMTIAEFISVEMT